MKNQSKGNFSFNFKKLEPTNPNLEQQEKMKKLFNCRKCGFHSKAISKFFIKGYDNDFIVQLISFHPEKPQKIIDLDKRKLKNDGELIQEVSCGICGNLGSIENVPEDILNAFGFNVYKSKKNKKDDFKK